MASVLEEGRERTEEEKLLGAELERVQTEKRRLEQRLLAQGNLSKSRDGVLWNQFIEQYYKGHKLELLKHTRKVSWSVTRGIGREDSDGLGPGVSSQRNEPRAKGGPWPAGHLYQFSYRCMAIS